MATSHHSPQQRVLPQLSASRIPFLSIVFLLEELVFIIVIQLLAVLVLRTNSCIITCINITAITSHNERGHDSHILHGHDYDYIYTILNEDHAFSMYWSISNIQWQ